MDRALLVGINAYPSAPLRGCINDVVDMAKHLHAHGFDDGEISLLTDRRATKRNIVAALQRLVSGVKSGDRIYFHYSGHGVQVPTKNAQEELDGLDEAICPYDFDWTDETTLSDKEFHQIFQGLPPGVEAVWVSDSCHSGNLDRDLGPQIEKPRFMHPPEDVAWDLEVVKRKKLKRRHVGSRSTERLNIALISGCASNQTSADANFGGRYNGALTYYLLQALKKHPELSLRETVRQVQESIRAGGYTQRPELLGPTAIIDQPFFPGGGA